MARCVNDLKLQIEEKKNQKVLYFWYVIYLRLLNKTGDLLMKTSILKNALSCEFHTFLNEVYGKISLTEEHSREILFSLLVNHGSPILAEMSKNFVSYSPENKSVRTSRKGI